MNIRQAWFLNHGWFGNRFPTAQRGSAMAFLAATGRAGSTVAQFANGWLIEKSVFVLLLCCATAMLLAAAFTMCLPVETGGVALDDVSLSRSDATVGGGAGGGGSDDDDDDDGVRTNPKVAQRNLELRVI